MLQKYVFLTSKKKSTQFNKIVFMCLTLFRQLNFFSFIVLKIENRSSETKAHN